MLMGTKVVTIFLLTAYVQQIFRYEQRAVLVLIVFLLKIHSRGNEAVDVIVDLPLIYK